MKSGRLRSKCRVCTRCFDWQSPQTALAKIQRTLMQPEVKQAGKEQVKKKAKESIMDMLAKAKINADRDNRERWEREGRIAPKKKHDMEL